MRPSLLSLPPHLRIAVHQHRTFCASTPRQSTLVDLATAGPSFIMDSLHYLGIPWHTTIPLTAVLIRSTFVYYISTLPAHKTRQNMNTLVPLVNAYTRLQQGSDRERLKTQQMSNRGVAPYQWAAHNLWTRFKYFQIAMWKYGNIFGTGGLRRLGTGLMNFGVLIAFTEAIRIKCGTKQGLLSVVLTPFEFVGRTIAPGQFEKVQDPAEVLAARMEKIAEAKGGEMVNLSDLKLPPPAPGPDITSPFFDSTLQTEGLSWCPDLTISDPTAILPLAVAVTMGASIVLRPTRTSSATKFTPSTTDSTEPIAQSDLNLPNSAALSPEAAATLAAPQPKLRPGFFDINLTIGQRVGLSVAALFALVAQNMPAAILLYFIPSIVVGWVQARWLDIKFPVRPAIQPCRRPLPMKKIKEW